MYDKQYVGGAAAGMGSLQGAAIGYQDAKPSQPTRLETCADHLGKMQQGFADMNGRLERIANRLAGAIPEPVEKSGNLTGGPTCTAHRFEITVEDFGAALRRMDSLVTRIEAL